MYSVLSEISQTITGPISIFLNSYAHSPMIVALLLGLIGAVAPCQITGNVSAITLYGNRTIQMKNNWGEILSFIMGKVVVYTSIGLLAWIFGQPFETQINEYFPIFRKIIGPLLIITGFVLLGIVKLKFLNRLTMHLPMRLKGGKLGSFLLGSSFAIAFCPTMFVLFFVWLMPIVLATSYGLVLPVIFGVATSIPLIIILVLIWLFDVKGLIMKKSVKVGETIQRLAGVILIIMGVLDAMIY
ncbi:sulfite exporter TauE/SafE family protein [Lysinibacillus sp. LZ02]|uniref:urease accessory protein UreH domain-containing protein n=1 Tax=Lysinibacillus sp. LZ02 TaxID=3420668 RepID=UPI003D35AAC0